MPEYKPGDDYVVPSSGVTLYAVWQKSLILSPKLENMTAYYMVVDTSGNVLSEGPVNGATPTATITVVAMVIVTVSAADTIPATCIVVTTCTKWMSAGCAIPVVTICSRRGEGTTPSPF